MSGKKDRDIIVKRLETAGYKVNVRELGKKCLTKGHEPVDCFDLTLVPAYIMVPGEEKQTVRTTPAVGIMASDKSLKFRTDNIFGDSHIFRCCRFVADEKKAVTKEAAPKNAPKLETAKAEG